MLMKPLSILILGMASLSAAFAASTADSVRGRWDASLNLNGANIAFRLDIAGEGQTLTGTLFNGDQTQTTTSARLDDGTLVLKFEHYLTTITANEKEGALEGKIEGRFGVSDKYISSYPFQAKRWSPETADAKDVPRIGGLWEIPYESPKGEKSWRFIVRQSGPDVAASILRIDGDTGSLTGRYHDGKFVLSHFDGSRPLALEVKPQSDGMLEIQTRGYRADKLVAYRPEVARARGLPEPANFTSHTTLRDPNEKFTFEFPDVNAKVWSSDDPKFKGKVVVAVVTGTWCPNCHDEAQYLVQLYKKYRDQGLEIVALDFEEPEQQDQLSRVRSFTKKYGVEYTYLIAGAPVEMWEKVPQAINLNTWPATFFVGRDGRVKRIHAGFAAPASGEFHAQLKQEFTSTVEQLLAEQTPQTTAANVASR